MSANLSGLIENGDFHLSFEQQLIALQLYSKCFRHRLECFYLRNPLICVICGKNGILSLFLNHKTYCPADAMT